MSRIFSGLFLIVLVIKVFDVFKNLVIASFLGVSENADIYSAMITIPDSLIVLLGLDTIKGVVNSEYSFYSPDKNREEMWKSFNNLLNILFWISLVVVSFILLFNNFIIGILLPGFEGIKKEKAVEISLFVFPILFFKVFIGYFHSVFNAVKSFYFPVTAPVIIGVVLLASVYFPFYKDDIIYNLAIGNLTGNILLFIIFTAGLIKLGGFIKFKRLEIDEVTKKVLKGSLSILLLVICNQLYLFSKNYFASYFGDGAISSLHYSGTVTSVITSLIFSTFFTVLISNLSTYLSEDKLSEAKNLFIRTLMTLMYVLTPLVIMFLICGEQILSLVFLRGNFDIEGIQMSLKPFYWDALSLLTFVMYIIPTALFLAKKNYTLLSKIGTVVYLSGILLNYISTKYLGYYAISMSTFFITGIYGCLLLFYSGKIFGNMNKYLKQFILILLSGLFSFLIIVNLLLPFFAKYDNPGILNNLFFLIINSTAIAILYFAFTALFKINYLREFLLSIRR